MTDTQAFTKEDIEYIDTILPIFNQKMTGYTCLYGIVGGNSCTVIAFPKESMFSGITDTMTGREIPIGYIRVVATDVDVLTEQLEYITKLLGK